MTANIVIVVCSFVYVISAIVDAAPSSKLPKGFIQCRISDPNFDECLKGGLEKALPHLAKGVPSLNIVKIDPLRISAVEIDQGKGPVSIKLNFKDLDIFNIKSVMPNTVHYEKGNNSLLIDLQVTKPIVLEGDYEISGKVLILPIVGKGKCKIELEVSKVVGNINLKYVVRNGITHFDVDSLSWKFIPTKLSLRLDNLFNGDKALGDNMNLFLNENWHEVLLELQPAIEDVFGIAFKEIGQQFLSRVSAKQIFLD